MAHFIILVLVLCTLVSSVQAQTWFTTSASSSSSQKDDDAVLKLEATAEKVLDSAEHVIVQAWRWTKSHRQIVKGIGGALIIGYGGSFANTLLLAKAVSVTGMPIIVKSMQEMAETYSKTRAALKEDLPAIVHAKSKLAHLQARQEILTQKISLAATDADANAYKTELRQIQTDLSKIAAVSSHMHHLIAAVDPAHLKTIAGQVYISLLAGVAAVSSQTAQAVTLGTNMAKIFSGLGKKFFGKFFGILQERAAHNESVLALEHLLDQNRAWASTAITTGSHLLAIVFAGMLKRVAQISSACALGSQMVFDSLEELIDPLLEQMGLPTLKSNPSAAAALQGSVVVVGVLSQMRGHHGMPWLVEMALAPVLVAEAILKKTLMK